MTRETIEQYLERILREIFGDEVDQIINSEMMRELERLDVGGC